MTAYEKELLALAVEKAPNHEFSVWRDEDGTWCADTPICAVVLSENLADALTALLRDLGVEVPERPSALDRTNASIRIEQIIDGGVTAHEALHHVAKIDRMAVLALLEGDES